MDEEPGPEPREAPALEELKLRPVPRFGLLLFGAVLFIFGVLSLFGSPLEYTNFVGQQVLAPLAMVIGAIMTYAGARGRIWS